MGKTTSFVLGEHFEKLINQQIHTGRYSSASEVVGDALRMFEEQQSAIKRLNDAIEEGYASGISESFGWYELFEQSVSRA
jgi:antitoxin ParD1/3/4